MKADWQEWRKIVRALPLQLRAIRRRGQLTKPRVIGITGSVGKTTTKQFLAAILRTRHQVTATDGSNNGRVGIPGVILDARDDDDFVVVEVGIRQPGRMWRSEMVVRPNAAIMTRVARVHMRDLRDLETVAREKAILMKHLPADGFAVLNGDDPRVAAMADNLQCPVVYFGLDPSRDVWADEISAIWPKRLSLRLHAAGESCRLQTRMVGEHWTLSVLAAATAALQCGYSLAEACEAMSDVEPFSCRLEPVDLPSGATALIDDNNGSPNSWQAALDIFAKAGARSRIIVTSGITDHPLGSAEGCKDLARQIAGCVETAIFIHKHAETMLRAAREAGLGDGRIADSLEHAVQMLREQLAPGDLVLVKGLWFHHLGRTVFALRGTIGCWKPLCAIPYECVGCEQLDFRETRGELITIPGAPSTT